MSQKDIEVRLKEIQVVDHTREPDGPAMALLKQLHPEWGMALTAAVDLEVHRRLQRLHSAKPPAMVALIGLFFCGLALGEGHLFSAACYALQMVLGALMACRELRGR